MNIVKNQIDALNAKLEVTISQEDFMPEVEKELKAYRKNANIPGFRKGQVPMGLIQKQYEKPLVVEKVNTLIQKSINDFLNQEKLAVLGNPLPIVNPEKPLDWDAKELNFTFELGLAPEISVDLSKAKVDKYELEIDPKQIEIQMDSLQKRFGENTVVSQIEADSNLTVSITEISDNQDAFFKEVAMLSVDKITDAAKAQFVGKSQGDRIKVSTFELFTTKTDLSYLLGISVDQVEALSEKLEFDIQSIVKIIPAPLDQDLFDKVYGKDAVDSVEAFRSKIEEESKEVYKAEMDKYFLNQAIEEVINVTPFELPEEFLLRWIQESNENITSLEQAKEEYQRSEKGLRYQLIEAKIAEQYNLSVTQEEVRVEARKMLDQQLKIYGQLGVEEEQIEAILNNALANQEEYQRMASQVFSVKLLQVLNQNVSINTKKMTFDDFLKEITEKRKA